MLTRLYVAAIHGSNEQGEYCSSDLDRLEPRYKLSTLLFTFFFTLHMPFNSYFPGKLRLAGCPLILSHPYPEHPYSQSVSAARNRLWVVAPSMLTDRRRQPMRQQQ